MRIAVDGMGGDNAPVEIVKGCIEAAKLIDDEIYIVGIEEDIRRELKKYRFSQNQIKIVNATQVVENEDAPVKAVRTKKDSSLVKGITLVKDGTCDFFISGGNTGAIMAGSLFVLGRIKGIERPAIGMIYPLLSGGFSFLCDAGANAECKPSHLVQFAKMGSIYMEKVLGVENPRVALINIGAEERKGTPVIKETYQLLKEETEMNFIGNVEARDIPYGAADVMVCDGFTGNVVLKLTEGFALRAFDMIKGMFTKNALSKVSALMVKNQLKGIKEMMDYSEYGGAPMLGVKGHVIKIHGASDAKAVTNAIIKGKAYVENDVVGVIAEAVAAAKPEKPSETEADNAE